jgi:hypothetical protein
VTGVGMFDPPEADRSIIIQNRQGKQLLPHCPKGSVLTFKRSNVQTLKRSNVQTLR